MNFSEAIAGTRQTVSSDNNIDAGESKNDGLQRCVIVGASHAGVNCAFALRKQGFEGSIVVIDTDKYLPYHRPPLSKAYLNTLVDEPPLKIKSENAYAKANITLMLGFKVMDVNVRNNLLDMHLVEDPTTKRALTYTYLVLATGASPVIPPIKGLKIKNQEVRKKTSTNILVMRNADDAIALKLLINNAHKTNQGFHALVLGAGYIGLETAASLRKIGAEVTVIEREQRPLARVASEEVSKFISALHSNRGVNLICNDSVIELSQNSNTKGSSASFQVLCKSGAKYSVDCLIVGVGVIVHTDLAQRAALQLDEGYIRVDGRMKTSNSNIWAIGDCTVFEHREYGDSTHIESVQNAVDQAKIAAESIASSAEKYSQTADVELPSSTLEQFNIDAPPSTPSRYNATPWFWSDQFDSKLQIVGLIKNTDNQITRFDSDRECSIWHFEGDVLRCVEAINSPKAYVLGSKWIAEKINIDKALLADTSVSLISLNAP